MAMDYQELDRKIITLGKQMVKMCTEAGSGHPSSALALSHLVTALMYRVMRYDPQDPWNAGADRLVLSEGHAVPAVYAAYCDLAGVAGTKDRPITLKSDDCATLREGASVLDGHPNPAQGFPFFDAATGSLGQGLSVAAGVALAARLDGSDKKVYCIIGDGESREGQIWEAVDFVVDHKLTNVVTIFNANGQGQSDYVSEQQSAATLAKKAEAYGCEVKVIDGHDWTDVFGALEAESSGRPIVIVAKTVKGWSVNELMKHTSHGKPLTAGQIEAAMGDLDAKAKELGVGEAADTAKAEVKAPAVIKRPAAKKISLGSFSEAMKAAGNDKALAAKKWASRRAYGLGLTALGKLDERIVALDGDVQGSTFAVDFAKAYPERYFEARIAEQNMISAAAGLAANGRIPFVSSFAKFLVRGYDQIEMAVISNANIKLCGSHAGVSLAADGPSQMGLPDLAFMRSFARSNRVDGKPAMQMMLPSDAVSAFKLMELMAKVEGMCYMRTHRPDVPFIYGDDDTFELGGSKVLAEGKDILLVASGYMVHVAKDAIELLSKQGVSAGLVDAYSIPLNVKPICERGSATGNKILVVEDNYIGGIGDEVTNATAAHGCGLKVETMYVRGVPKSAKTPDAILEQVDLTANDVAKAAAEPVEE